MQQAKFDGDSPMARFGHTITPIGKDRAILFGGAVGDTGKYVITGDTFICDYNHKKWKKLQPKGNPPSNRAAHASLCIDHFFFVYGGALGGGQLADQNLYVLDFLGINDKAFWAIKQTKGPSPGARYGHVMGYLKPYLIIHGGNTGSQAVGDIWKIDILGSATWQKVNIPPQQSPPPRVYHSASICKTGTASGMMVIFGGRGSDQIPLNDTWGLRKHRDGRLDWMKAPSRNNKQPAQRYQHRSLFVGTLLLIIGGRNNTVGQALALDIYDTDTSDWYRLNNIERFRHSCFMIDHNIYIHGGFDQEMPNIPTDKILCLDLNKIFNPIPALFKGLAYQIGKDIIIHSPSNHSHNNHNQNQNTLGNSLKSSTSSNSGRTSTGIIQQRNVNSQQIPRRTSQKMDIEYPNNKIPKRKIQTTNRSIRLCSQAVVANFQDQNQVKKVHVDMLPTQHRRLVAPINLTSNKQSHEKVYKYFINQVLCKPLGTLSFPIQQQYTDKLCEGVNKILEQQPTLLNVKLPVKIFGDIHGQLGELNRLFDAFGSPSDQLQNGDIQSTNYIFLGDYVDRGHKSLQTILLLLSLKLKFPQNVFLLRGAHEDRKINKFMGFGDECAIKLKQNIEDPYSVWNQINRLFEKMPLAALVQDSILCVHGGIGNTVRNLAQIDSIPRPIKVNYEPKTKQQKIVYELLWSDPCGKGQSQYLPNTSHDYFGLKNNLKFSESRANQFCAQNDLMTIIRSHEPVFQGFETKQSYITIFSSSDYGFQGNKASIISINKNEEVIPKLLGAVPSSLGNSKESKWLNLQDYKVVKASSNQDQILRKMSFTPPKR